MPVWNDKMAAQQAPSGQVSVISAFTWSLLLCNAYQFCSSNVWIRQYHFVQYLGYEHHYSFLYISNEISLAQTTRHTSGIHTEMHAGE